MRLLFFGLLIGLVAAGCKFHARGVEPSQVELHFPTAAALSPGGKLLLVANSNFDLAWEMGTLLAIDLDATWAMVEGCPKEGCEPFENNEEFVLKEETVLIGSYSSFMSLSPGGMRIYITVRGNNSLTTVNLDENAGPGQKLSCFRQDGGGGRRECDRDHVVQVGDGVELPSDPYALNTDLDGWVFVSHLASNQVSIFSVDRKEDIGRDIPPKLLYVDSSFPQSVSAIKKHPAGDFLYATSRDSSSVPMFRFVWDEQDYENAPSIYYGPPIRMTGLQSGDDARDIDFAPDGSMAYITNRSPNALILADTSLTPGGWPTNKVKGVIPLDQGPSLVKVWQPPGSDRYFVYVTCYDADRIHVIDPFLRARIDTIATADGPHAMVTDPYRRLGYIINFIASTISVVDLDPQSPLFNKIRATLGRPKAGRKMD